MGPLPLLLPGSEGIRSSSFAITTIQKLTDAVAPKLSQDDELFALGLADAAQEFFGEDMGDFVRGENVLSPEAVQSVIDTMSRILTLVQGSSSSEGSIETSLQDAMNNLNSSERKRLDDIVNELTQRSITRFLERLSSVERS